MMNLRTLFIALVLLNLLFFAWAQGYFGRSEEGREGQRLERQLSPEKLKVVGAKPAEAKAPEAKPPVQACRLIDGLSPDEGRRLMGAAQESAPSLKFESRASEEQPSYWVLIPPLPDRAAAERKMAELRRLGISGYQLVEEEGAFKLGIVLGAFKDEGAANEFLQGLGRRGLRSARLQAREKTVLKVQLTVLGPADSLEEKLRLLLQAYSAATLTPCREQP